MIRSLRLRSRRKAPLRRRIQAFFGDVLKVFQVPFAGLPVVVWAFVVISAIVLPYNAVWLGELPDPDDYTYLTQTLDWLQGQSWYDNVQHRMSPPEGVPIHYTRLAELPIAAVIGMFRLLGYSWRGAALLGSYLLPVLYLGVFFYVSRKVAERFVSPSWARLTAFVALFCPALLWKFSPGQVDHHGLEALLLMGALGLVAQTFSHPEKRRWPLFAGGVLALSVAIGLETLPWMCLIVAVVGFWAVWTGTKAARSAILFGAGLFGFGAAFLFLVRAPSVVLQEDILSYSSVYVLLMAGAWLSLIVAAGASFLSFRFGVKESPKFFWKRSSPFLGTLAFRLLLTGGAAAVLGALYLHHVPALLEGPYGAMNKTLASLFFANLEEAIAMVDRYSFFKVAIRAFLPVLALIVSVKLACRTRDDKRWAWIMLAVLLAASVNLALFYQVRMVIYAQLFSIIPLVALAENGWAWIGTRFEGRRRFWAEIGLIVLIGPLTGVFLPSLFDGRAVNPGLILFPAQQVNHACTIQGIKPILNGTPYDKRPLRIMNLIGEGPALLFYTPHEVMSAPYHTNVRGNLDTLEFFSTTDPNKAEQIARKNKIDLVVVCHNVPDLYLNGSDPHYVALPSGGAQMLPNESFVGQLAQDRVPAWLRKIPFSQGLNYSIYEVQ
ncbi:MAG: hypothetical protein PHS57_01400 [Alphaproteobacteria bacterium]|nr:hypothetical protein [Alphaproteobacteria bacterium]